MQHTAWDSIVLVEARSHRRRQQLRLHYLQQMQSLQQLLASRDDEALLQQVQHLLVLHHICLENQDELQSVQKLQ